MKLRIPLTTKLSGCVTRINLRNIFFCIAVAVIVGFLRMKIGHLIIEMSKITINSHAFHVNFVMDKRVDFIDTGQENVRIMSKPVTLTLTNNILGVKIISLMSHTLIYNKTVQRIKQNQEKIFLKPLSR